MTRNTLLLLVFGITLTGCNKDDQRHEVYRQAQSRADWVYRSYQNARILAKEQKQVHAGLPPAMPAMPDGWSIVPRVRSVNESEDATRIDAAVIYTHEGEQSSVWFFSEEYRKRVVVDPGTDIDLYIEWVFSDCVFFADKIIGLMRLSGLWEPIDSSVQWEHNTSQFQQTKHDNGAEEWLYYNGKGKIVKRKLVRADGTTQCVEVFSCNMGVIVYARTCGSGGTQRG